MSTRPEIVFESLSADLEPTVVVLAGDGASLSARGKELDQRAGGAFLKAADAAQFKGRRKSTVEVLAPAKLGSVKRVLLLGTGKAGDMKENDWILLGGSAAGAIGARKTASASIIAETPEGAGIKSDALAALLAFGASLRNYEFSKYITKKSSDDEAANGNGNGAESDGLQKLVVHCANPDKARAAYAHYAALANGIVTARDLVNEPANALGPVEFADRVKALEASGLEVEILDNDQITELKMGALLAVAQGSVRPARVAIMQWNGAKSKRTKPVCFVGKGVVFDTGGISIKPAGGMEDMKGDMGGAAAVVGTMQALAERKANVNAIGIIGLVENMPSGTATRPGDIVRAHSGHTVEVLNTDAEGRLVLADLISYVQERYKPRLMIDLATLTGAIMVALGKEYAGLFASDDKLAADLLEASAETGEKLWRMPLDKAYDKMLESKNCDIKNIGGRYAGSCTAAAFIKYFVDKDIPWAHIDLAGTAMDAPKNEISPSWGAGWGVRLLDRFVADNYEKNEK
ncbi:leucyl aminopeptidase [Hyphomicrobium sulfonivorans]|uniref:leucyl aminopeptidase n=1 Tax=Hyphomicrobium sulfonivorans TaxID=121290 RepID=UPI00157001C0|nr:leucyl aminopeptidase [Hyphomicrobium sulfonivorans]MBI1650529.1 leucyl aminopeptidase [Hyphomicrobium sulfonivorans]NSL72113.1 leucyl aminopeptidase [Hyphomicrobium sulfonivorans]